MIESIFNTPSNLDNIEVLSGDVDIVDLMAIAALNDLSDINISSLSDNHFLIYDNSSSKWINKSPANSLLSLGVTATASELNYLDLTTLGTSEASKALTVNASGDLIVPDGDKFQFGTGLDMTLYHDGTNSYISNLTGALKIATETSGIAVEIGHSTSQVSIGDDLSVAGNVVVTGNLTVNGTTTTVNSTVTTLDDPIITLGGDTAPSSDDNKDRGVEFRWHNGSAAKVGFFGYDDSLSKFTFIPDATNSSEVFSGTAGDVAFGAGEFIDHLTLKNAKSLKLSELDSNGSHTVSIKAPDSVTADVTLVLPDGAGSNGQTLTTDGSGVLSWSTVSSGLSSSDITGQSAKTTVNDNDLVVIADSQDSNNLKKMTRANFVAGLTANKTYSAKTASFTAAVNYHYSVNTSGGAVTVSLPQISSTTPGESIAVKFRSGTNTLTLTPYSGNTIEGLSNLILTDSSPLGQSITLVSDGTSSWEVA